MNADRMERGQRAMYLVRFFLICTESQSTNTTPETQELPLKHDPKSTYFLASIIVTTDSVKTCLRRGASPAGRESGRGFVATSTRFGPRVLVADGSRVLASDATSMRATAVYYTGSGQPKARS